jgi:hypothetical protein
MRSYVSHVRVKLFYVQFPPSYYSRSSLHSNRLSHVCRLWWEVSTDPLLWHTVDLATGRVNEKYRTERKLVWLLQNRLSRVQDLALGKRRYFVNY